MSLDNCIWLIQPIAGRNRVNFWFGCHASQAAFDFKNKYVIKYQFLHNVIIYDVFFFYFQRNGKCSKTCPRLASSMVLHLAELTWEQWKLICVECALYYLQRYVFDGRHGILIFSWKLLVLMEKICSIKSCQFSKSRNPDGKGKPDFLHKNT